MDRVFALNIRAALLIFIVADLLCVAMGMGVPIFSIGFGFLVGWYISKRATLSTPRIEDAFRTVFVQSIVTSAVTFVVMSVLWGPTIPMLLDPNSDFLNFGIPLILYDPKLSFIGWIVLMTLISPFLQLLTTLFGSYLVLLRWLSEDGSDGKGT